MEHDRPQTVRTVEPPLSTRAAGAARTVGRAEGVRADIQGLRAIAVAVVLVFHFWPWRLTGGYVGVDVFFVISGFLISSHLFRHPPTTPRLLGAFWARRIRRLLPAASLVLALTLVAGLVWLPSPQVPTLAREVVASAVSLENWALAATATDYLAAESAPSPVQHYWSLSIEEQFYVLWPLLIAALALLGRRHAGRWRGLGLLVVTAASFAASVLITRSDPAAAYFVTHTRIWELGLGALLALLVHRGWRLRGRFVRAAVAWLGLAAIAVAVVTFDGSTAFPGYAALLPTLGTALVIAADADPVPWSPRRLLGWRPSQFLGDVSYSVYLWHWPVVVILPHALGHDLLWTEKVAAVAAVLLVGWLSKRFVEDPVRRARSLAGSLPRSFAIAAVSVLVLGSVGVGIVRQAEASQAAEQRQVAQALTRDCVGAAALRDPSCPSTTGSTLINSPSAAKADRSVLYADGCWSNAPYTSHPVCTYGAEGGTRRVALLGNSHAGHWQPALADIAQRHGWRIDTFLASQCYTVSVPIEFRSQQLTDNCLAWNRWAVQRIVDRGYDLVVMSDRTFLPLEGVRSGDKQRVAQGSYADVLDRFTAAGVPVLVLRDVPSAVREAPDCVAEHLDDLDACSNSQRRAVEPDPLAAAAAADASGDVHLLDLTDRFCRNGRCHVVIGGILAYFDHGHLTTAFARTLVPDLEPTLVDLLRAP